MELSFNSPTYGQLSFTGVLEKILAYLRKEPACRYRIIIGTDSQTKNSRRVDFVSAVVVHRVGAGGIYFWRRSVEERKYFLRQRIYEEALRSLRLAQQFISAFPGEEILGYELEIHVDIGAGGETRDMLAEIIGMVRGMGFNVRTKPESFGASSVADRYA
ncbi:MAG: hypothetical protein DRI56_12620 [Chloroflexota bacterium]|nr:MAG: hypothetical protein DRI56_12620 [Chloroflexota bacterium]